MPSKFYRDLAQKLWKTASLENKHTVVVQSIDQIRKCAIEITTQIAVSCDEGSRKELISVAVDLRKLHKQLEDTAGRLLQMDSYTEQSFTEILLGREQMEYVCADLKSRIFGACKKLLHLPNQILDLRMMEQAQVMVMVEQHSPKLTKEAAEAAAASFDIFTHMTQWLLVGAKTSYFLAKSLIGLSTVGVGFHKLLQRALYTQAVYGGIADVPISPAALTFVAWGKSALQTVGLAGPLEYIDSSQANIVSNVVLDMTEVVVGALKPDSLMENFSSERFTSSTPALLAVLASLTLFIGASLLGKKTAQQNSASALAIFTKLFMGLMVFQYVFFLGTGYKISDPAYQNESTRVMKVKSDLAQSQDYYSSQLERVEAAKNYFLPVLPVAEKYAILETTDATFGEKIYDLAAPMLAPVALYVGSKTGPPMRNLRGEAYVVSADEYRSTFTQMSAALIEPVAWSAETAVVVHQKYTNLFDRTKQWRDRSISKAEREFQIIKNKRLADKTGRVYGWDVENKEYEFYSHEEYLQLEKEGKVRITEMMSWWDPTTQEFEEITEDEWKARKAVKTKADLLKQ